MAQACSGHDFCASLLRSACSRDTGSTFFVMFARTLTCGTTCWGHLFLACAFSLIDTRYLISPPTVCPSPLSPVDGWIRPAGNAGVRKPGSTVPCGMAASLPCE